MRIKKIFEEITGIAHLKDMHSIANERIENLTNILLRQSHFLKLQKQLAEKNEEIKQVEKTLEGTIDQQYEEIQRLRTQLEHARNNRIGKYYVFNPHHGQPRKIYNSYEAAMKDAESVAKISKGQKVFVLKIVSGVQISENYEDYSLIPEEEIPF